jgi:hypothetical protein
MDLLSGLADIVGLITAVYVFSKGLMGYLSKSKDEDDDENGDAADDPESSDQKDAAE